jgi:SAM-dependent methyltransferase
MALGALKARLGAIYRRENFAPTWLGIFVNPFYFARRGLYRGIVAQRHRLSGRLLDFGCGRKPYQPLFAVSEYVGLDIEESGHSHRNESIDVYYDGKVIPFGDAHFDSAFSTQVFEHVFNLDDMLGEIHRVLKPGALLLATVPFVWDEHEVPYDFGRYTSFGLTHVLQKAGFEVVEFQKSTNYVETVFQMWNAYVNQVVLPSNKLAKALLTVVFVAPVTLLGIVASALLPASRDFYLDNIVVARRV